MFRSFLLAILFLSLPSLVSAQPSKSGSWITDYAKGLAEAKKSGKPIFLVFRCEPCADCAKFDEQVLRLNPEIRDVAEAFVRVRLTRITGVDLNLFEFDYDCTWFAFFLNADEQIYGRYGGRDAESAEGRTGLKSLKFALDKALEKHNDPKREKIAPKNLVVRKVEDYPAAKKKRGNDCIHCHLVNEFQRDLMQKKGEWKRTDLQVYPLPENIGIILDQDRGDLVKAVFPQSPAQKIGLQKGDRLAKVNGTSIASFADLSYALHKAPQSGEIAISWIREREVKSDQLSLSDGWRKTNLAWRPSLIDLLARLQVSGEDLTSEEKKSLAIPENHAAVRQDKFVHSTLKAAGLQNNDILVGINGKGQHGTMKDLEVYVRKTFLAGDKITLNILRDGKKLELMVELK